jgi:hypothetical protein
MFSPDGQLLAVKVAGRVEIRNLTGVRRTTILELSPHRGGAMTFSPDGKTLALARSLVGRESLQTTHDIRLWDSETGRDVRSIPGVKGPVSKLAFSPDGTALAVATMTGYDPALRKWQHREVKLLDVATGSERRSLPGTSMTFSPDGRTLAVVTDGPTLRLVDWVHGRELRAINGARDPGVVSFSRDGRRLCFAGAVWDVASGREICRLKGNDPLTAFSLDGQRLFSVTQTSSTSGIFRVWDATTGDLLLATTVPGGRLTVHPDGWRCAVASGRTGVWVVDARPPTPELRVQHQAQGLVAYLFRKQVVKEDVSPALLALRTISEPVREAALAQARQLENDADLINDVVSEVLPASDRPPEEYRRALRWAEEGARLAPDEGYVVQNVGIALYRVGRYEEAATVLRRTYEMNPKAGVNSQWDLLFLAMAEAKLGRQDDAKATFKRVSPRAVRADVWREAQELIEGIAAEPRP